ncbi:TPA: lpg0405 family Dot/Icm T4SS effector [Legionella pneumophila]|nr:lpg0405 family Dot/Icm T4SS effector [Legionella pneumophila]HAU2264672.1 lpg0405 family Dot/Icm T4SS effector [Legionella pneumophila]HBD7141511.1 lpg0405 family Dot/Icm T4SS effector [Legionella pneumophila]
MLYNLTRQVKFNNPSCLCNFQKMGYIDELLEELSARLPELEWKINGLSSSISIHNLPKGIFSSVIEFNGPACIKEIRDDIHALQKHKDESIACFLAERIQKKINVLVVLCQMDKKNNKPESKISFDLTTLSTRQQWIKTMEEKICALEEQYQAMRKTLEQMKSCSNPATILRLQTELGNVEKRLTLAKETLDRAIS